MTHAIFRRRGDQFPGLFEHTMEHGGATVNVKTGEHYTKKEGFSVGMTEGTFRLVPVNAPLSHHHKAMREAAAYPNATHLGTWLKEGNIHYDPTEIVEKQDEAERKGRERKQKAIYSHATGEDINL